MWIIFSKRHTVNARLAYTNYFNIIQTVEHGTYKREKKITKIYLNFLTFSQAHSANTSYRYMRLERLILSSSIFLSVFYVRVIIFDWSNICVNVFVGWFFFHCYFYCCCRFCCCYHCLNTKQVPKIVSVTCVTKTIEVCGQKCSLKTKNRAKKTKKKTEETNTFVWIE